MQSLDALHYPLQNLPHRMSGYVEFSQDTLISGGKFKGCTASAGQIACVEAQADGAYLLPVWRGEMQLTDEIGTYHPFADWETAEPGDIIGGFTTFYGKQQGHGKAAAREHNISEGVKRIDGVAVEREETFSFNALCAPYRACAECQHGRLRVRRRGVSSNDDALQRRADAAAANRGVGAAQQAGRGVCAAVF